MHTTQSKLQNVDEDSSADLEFRVREVSLMPETLPVANTITTVSLCVSHSFKDSNKVYVLVTTYVQRIYCRARFE